MKVFQRKEKVECCVIYPVCCIPEIYRRIRNIENYADFFKEAINSKKNETVCNRVNDFMM